MVSILGELGLEPNRNLMDLEQQILMEAPTPPTHLAGDNRPNVPIDGGECVAAARTVAPVNRRAHSLRAGVGDHTDRLLTSS